MGSEMKVNASLIKHLREERGWSQEQLAAIAGLSARTIQRLEAEGKASRESRSALAAAFEVDAAMLAEDAPIDAERTKAVIASWRHWLGNSASAEAKALRVFLVMLSAWFIYQAGRAAGETWYYLMH